MSKKRCRIHYRRLRRENSQFPEASLAQALTSALRHRTADGSEIGMRVANRVTTIPNNEEYRRLVNNFFIEERLVFGDLCLFSPGQLQALLELAKDEDHASLSEILAAWRISETRAPDGTEYLHGISYWMAIDDHFYQIQHPSITTKSMEEYLTWLLRDKTRVLNATEYVELQAEFDRDQIGDDLSDVKTIEVGGIVPETMHGDASEQKGTKQAIDVESRSLIGDLKAKTFDKGKKIIAELIGDVEAQKILDSMPPQAALEVTVNIGYRSRKRKFIKEFMSNLASGLRNIPDGEIRVRGRDGEIKGDDARLSLDMNVKKIRDTSSLLDLSDALLQMKEVHRRFLFDGRIKSQ